MCNSFVFLRAIVLLVKYNTFFITVILSLMTSTYFPSLKLTSISRIKFLLSLRVYSCYSFACTKSNKVRQYEKQQVPITRFMCFFPVILLLLK